MRNYEEIADLLAERANAEKADHDYSTGAFKHPPQKESRFWSNLALRISGAVFIILASLLMLSIFSEVTL